MKFSFFQPTNLPIHLHIVSQTPKRIRLRIAPEHRQEEVMEEIKDLLPTFLGGVEQVRTNLTTGSVTIYFAQKRGGLEDVFSCLREGGIVVSDVPSQPATAAARLTSSMAALNRRVNLATEGSLDLRFLLPLFLAALALRQFFSGGPRLNTAPWYILAWYAFDSFMKLNAAGEEKEVKTAAPSSDVPMSRQNSQMPTPRD
jgi:hypothetical protein